MNKFGKYLRNPFALFNYLAMRGLFTWMPDDLYLKLLYRARTGKRLDLDNPVSFNEKQQWLKIHGRDPRHTVLVDKHLVKGVVSELLGSGAVVPTLGVWENASQIDFSTLPNQFVLKTNHDSGGVIICRDKQSFDTAHAVSALNARLKRSYYPSSREWPYRDVLPVVFAEEYLPDAPQLNAVSSGIGGIIDYKFYCFNGQPRFLYVSQGLEDHATARCTFLGLDWAPLGFSRSDFAEFERIPPRPHRFDEMLEAAKELSTGIPFVRVDFFEHQGRLLFSEMTFFPGSGMTPFVPMSADLRIGALLELERFRAEK